VKARRTLALLAFALGAVGRRRGRSAALVAGLAFVVALYGAVIMLVDALRHEYETGARYAPDLAVQALVAGRPGLVDVDVATAIAALPGVRRVTPRVWGYLYVPPIAANVTVVGLGDAVLARRETLEDGATVLASGRMLAPGSRGACLLGAMLADALGLRDGDEVALAAPGGTHVLRVEGVLAEASALRSADLLLTSEQDARALLGVPPGRATDLAVELTTVHEARVVTRKVAELLPGARVIDREAARRAYALTFDGRGGLLSALLLPALSAFLLLAWDRLSGLSEAERREIGVLKAIGWETRDVLAVRLIESGLISAAGATLGLWAGYAYAFWWGAPGLGDALFAWSAVHPPLDLSPHLEPALVAAIVAGVVVPFVSASLVPAWRAAVLDPDRAMRGGA
jgi:ABC-type lipoprotein release transport system permease subunit